jgi:regulator of protease activity HflC (stomatin/prohibitin superfamily)
MTRDSVTVKVNAILYYKVHDPSKAVISVKDINMQLTWPP